MRIDVWSDVVCPWCYLGKQRLDRAIADFGAPVDVTYRAFQLDPSPVAAPQPLRQALAAKFGGVDRADQMFANVTAIAAAEGLAMDFSRAVAANTFDAHRLVVWAAGQGRQHDMVDALYRAHFADGVDIGDRTALATVATGIGLDADAAWTWLAGDDGADAVRAELSAAHDLGITSVPTFVVDRRYAIQGAQDPDTLRAALEKIAGLDPVT